MTKKLVDITKLTLGPAHHMNTLHPGSDHLEADCPGRPTCSLGRRYGADDLQELYFHLDHATHGNLFLAWYGQCRAKGLDHLAALDDTLEHFNIRSTDWYQHRLNSTKKDN